MIRLGVMGMSEGNGHPFSWSAIVNGGYNPEPIGRYGYGAISVYLSANQDTLGIDGAKVTHVWTQERKISEDIAAGSMIENVVDNAEDMIGNVDAILLARDDPENHVVMAKPFLDAGVPIFIDKPLAITKKDLDYFNQQVKAGKFLMSCSSMRYATENRAVKTEFDSLGPIELVTAVGKKDWIKYGVHMLEGLFALMDDPKAAVVKHISKSHKDIVYVEFETGLVATVHLFYDITPTFQVSVFGQNDWRLIEYKNYYAMFRDNLNEFIRSVQAGKPRLDFAKTENIIRTLIGAQQSLENQGKSISL
ncbi:MAG: Gfo/Idh/MocA family oxidoreductase [Sedimentisphaerales bacterium]|nr:Gfo/Idh/MocA family oxidoreductase [Sedimentisphaerales bacterium]